MKCDKCKKETGIIYPVDIDDDATYLCYDCHGMHLHQTMSVAQELAKLCRSTHGYMSFLQIE